MNISHFLSNVIIEQVITRAYQGTASRWLYLDEKAKHLLSMVRSKTDPDFKNRPLSERLSSYVVHGGSVDITYNLGCNGGKIGELNQESICRGISAALKQHPDVIKAELEGKGTDVTADILAQFFVFGCTPYMTR